MFLLLGLLSFYQLSQAPSFYYIAYGLSILALALIIQKFIKLNVKFLLLTCLIGYLVGFAWAWFSYSVEPVVETNFLNKPVQIVGTVVGLPKFGVSNFGNNRVQFTFAIASIKDIANSDNVKEFTLDKPVISLNWFEGNNNFIPTINAGDRWCLPVKLKPNHATFNPSSFDFEKHLFINQIVARGTVSNRFGQSLLLREGGFNLRFWLSKNIDILFENSEFIGIYRALLIGEKSQITAQQWDVFQKTGTIHLMAISGLHIGIMAMIGFVVFGLLWQGLIRVKSFNKVRQVPKILFSALAVLFLISLYLSISGAAIATQRAWIMAVVLIMMLFLGRKLQPWSSLAIAAILVVIWQPSSILSAGFWLSFGAVVLIFITLANNWVKSLKLWQKAIVIQLVLTIGLMPSLAFYFQHIPIVSGLANLVVVPLVSILALPLLFFTLLIGLIFADVSPIIFTIVTEINHFVWFWIWQYLGLLVNWFSYANSYWLIGKVAVWQVVLLYIIWWVIYKYKVTIWLSLVFGSLSFILIIVIFSIFQINKPKTVGEVKLTVLDVGQAQALVIETKNHVLVYDTGAKWGDKLDGAKLAVLPYLRHQKINKIDLLMISHSDLDHAGGVASILKNIAVKEHVSGQYKRLNKMTNTNYFTTCHQKQWLFDEVKFAVISNPTKKMSDNDQSCVLQISTGTQSIMISGDASKSIEYKLINEFGASLSSSILIAGHHGSNTSTSKLWLDTVKPEKVVFTAGYGNRFGFPRKEVVARIEQKHIKWLNTACSGAIKFTMTPNSWQLISQERLLRQRLFHHQCKVEL